MRLRAVKQKRLHEEITAQIRRQFAEERWEPGDRLPPERDPAKKFQASVAIQARSRPEADGPCRNTSSSSTGTSQDPSMQTQE